MATPPYADQVTISQGVWGTVQYEYPGTCSAAISPAEREIVLYLPVTAETPKRVYLQGYYFAAITGTVVSATKSNSDGFFQLALTAGTYSAFVKEGTQYYTNLPISQFMSLVTVATGKTTHLDFVFHTPPPPSL